LSPNPQFPALKALHSRETLVTSKLVHFEALATDTLAESLTPGQRACLKTRADGTIIDEHHRIHILRPRGIDVDVLPREVIEKEDL
jgi:hypothetical protein